MTLDHVFIYGSLKDGEPNHAHMRRCTFVSRAYVPGFALLDLGDFPGMVPARCPSDDWAEGEVYRMNDVGDTLTRLDALEAEGKLYRRVALEVVFPEKNNTQKWLCWTYLFMPEYQPRTLIPGGHW